jgi:CRP-like cAMP-binding protein
MSVNASSIASAEPAFARLMSLAPLPSSAIAILHDAARAQQFVSARQELISEGQAITQALILLSGWAYRVRMLRDGRRQILGFLLPGDLIGNCRQERPTAITTVIALTDISVCAAPSLKANPNPSLAEAFAVSGALEEHYLFRQITRLGRLSAIERLADWVFEIRERLDRCGLVQESSFRLPLTQELIADTLGLTSVHVNRSLKAMYHDGLLKVHGGILNILSDGRMSALVDYRAPVVTSVPPGY